MAIASSAAEAAKDNATAALGSNRAFVHATPYWFTTDEGGAYFGVGWTSGGNTPTRELRTYIDYVVTDGELPADFVFPEDASPIARGFLAPKQMFNGPRIPATSPLDVSISEQVRTNAKKLYFFGWAKYFDMFHNTPERITKFCFLVNGGRGEYGFPVHDYYNEAT
ncbi:MAG TPA: hypothetical protein VLA61_27870 [Ideonella sp.]|uniref:hypothetical protein n=1 Tax=Ideonella sp. TaxID=1929293 RepID=UPI002CD17CC1|nr:hypothetical protein [Ideonella sp.]HSI52102.1 hypothetical protein [Ideonella sp.]